MRKGPLRIFAHLCVFALRFECSSVASFRALALTFGRLIAASLLRRLDALDALAPLEILTAGRPPRDLPGMRILVIEDERQLAGHVTRALTRHGHCLTAAHDGLEGVQVAMSDPPDLILLDLNLPGLDGLSVLSKLREAQCTARVLILTARGEVEHRVKGLHAGADDYLTKPFSLDELVARVEALGRRSTTTAPADLLKVSDLHMDVRHRRVTRSGKPIALSPREFDVLQVLMQEPGRPFSRTELCERVWQRDHEYDTRTVEIFITRLRKKIDSTFSAPLIHTLRGVGYAIRE